MTPRANAVPLLHDYLEASARRLPQKVALVAGAERITYAELDGRANALANALVDRGVARSDRVLVFAESSVTAVVAFWGALKANAVVSMIHPQTKPPKFAYVMADCRPTALVTEHRLRAVFAAPASDSPYLRATIVDGPVEATLRDLPNGVAWSEALHAASSDRPPERRAIDVDLAAIVYTSGSTGDPKGVMLTHRNMLSAATSIATYLELQEDDVIIDVLPLSFDYGLYQLILSCRAGARLVLERGFAFPAKIVSVMKEEGVTGFPGVPTMFALLAEMKSLTPEDFPSVRFVTNTAAALPLKHIDVLKRLFPRARIYSMYGLTECKRCTYLPPEDLDRKPSSVGIAIPNTEFWIVDEEDRRVGPDVVGQLVIRGATVMRGYWEKPEATAERLRPGPLPGELVLYTGDYGKTDEEGYLYFVGRMDDMIKSRGEKVAPREVENALVSIPGVKEAAVIGVRDDFLGEAVKAFVSLERGATLTPRELLLGCQGRLPAFAVPAQIEIVAELPKTGTGKIRKLELA